MKDLGNDCSVTSSFALCNTIPPAPRIPPWQAEQWHPKIFLSQAPELWILSFMEKVILQMLLNQESEGFLGKLSWVIQVNCM